MSHSNIDLTSSATSIAARHYPLSEAVMWVLLVIAMIFIASLPMMCWIIGNALRYRPPRHHADHDIELAGNVIENDEPLPLYRPHSTFIWEVYPIEPVADSMRNRNDIEFPPSYEEMFGATNP
jgi:hypothetical protein